MSNEPTVRPTAFQALSSVMFEIMVERGFRAASASGPPEPTRSGPFGRLAAVRSARSSPSAT